MEARPKAAAGIRVGGKGIGQAPGDKHEGCLGDIGMPVEKPSAEHNGLAGGSVGLLTHRCGDCVYFP